VLAAPVTRIHVNRGVDPRYHVQGKLRGGRKWHTIDDFRSKEGALICAAMTLSRSMFRRVRVLHTADYYEPIQIAWMEIP